MKKLRLISLLLVAVFVLTTFSGAMVFGDEVIEDTPVTEGTGETVPEVEITADYTHTNENAAMAFQLLTTEFENGEAILQAAARVEERSLSVYVLKDVSKTHFSVERIGSDFLGLYTYNGADMIKIPAADKEIAGNLVNYDLTVVDEAGKPYLEIETLGPVVNTPADDETGEDGDAAETPAADGAQWIQPIDLFVIEVSSVSSTEIAQLGSMTEAERFEWKVDNRGEFTSEAQRVSAMKKYAEAGDLVLYVDEELAEIAVHNTKTDEYMFSSPYNYNRVTVPSVATKSQLASIVELKYYDNSANRKIMYAFDDAVEKTKFEDPDDPNSYNNSQFEAVAIENGVRFDFNIGETELDTLLPWAAEVNNFNEKVLNPLKERADAGDDAAKTAYTKLIAFYNRGKVYHYDDLTSSLKQSIAADYPGIKEHDFYILRSGVYPRDQLLLTSYIRMTGLYTQADFDNDLELSGYEPEDTFYACFEFSMEITLEDGALKVNIPTEAIKYDDEHFTLAEITPLRYFGCGNYQDEDGFVFFPDGSGVVINFNTNRNKTWSSLSKKVYGDDFSLLTTTAYNNLNQSAYLPVYGVKTENHAYLAVIEKGDAMATIQSETGNLQSPFETVYPIFTYRTVQTINYTDGTKENGEFTYFNENVYTGGFAMRYLLMFDETPNDADQLDYVDMAVAYREYLQANGRLVNGVGTNKNTPLVLETLGLIDKKASMMGIVYDKKVAMTTFDDAQSMMEELAQGGIGNVSLRYRGWMNGGLNYSVPSKLKIESKLGGKDGFTDLLAYINEKNYNIYPEVDFCIVRRDNLFDGYSTTGNAPKMTDRTTVTLTPRNELDNVMEIENNYFAIAPSSTTKFFKAFFGKYAKYNATSIGLGTTGNMLYSDFAKKNGSNRQEALNTLLDNVKNHVTANGINKIMVEGGNAYTYQYATEIVDMPLSGSNTLLADYSVPFMQIVLHGHIPYSGTSLNMADNIVNTVLKSAEYGANLHFTLSKNHTRELKETVYSNYFTIDFATWQKDVVTLGGESLDLTELYAKFNAAFASLQDKEITGHERITDAVGNVLYTITTYEDGTRVAVNYSRAEQQIGDTTLAAQDFTVL